MSSHWQSVDPCESGSQSAERQSDQGKLQAAKVSSGFLPATLTFAFCNDPFDFRRKPSLLESVALYFSEVPAEFPPGALTGKNLQNVTLSRCEVVRDANARCSSWQGTPKIELLGNTVID